MNIYTQRREQLLAQLDEQSVVILVGNQSKTRSKNINYHFRPDNDLFYLTGFSDQNAVAVLRPQAEHPFVMFVRPNDAAAETNFGSRPGVAGTVSKFKAGKSFDIAQLSEQIPLLLEKRSKVYYLDEQSFYQQEILEWIAHQRRNTGFDVIKQYRQLLPLQPLLHNARRIKDEHEIAAIKHAVKASIHGHKAVMSVAKANINEGILAATFDREIANFNCHAVGYPSIVAGGNNACCLHYEENNCEVADGQLLLIDAGAEYQMYTADITRTWPINGRFSGPQAQLYQVVLNALDAAISQVKPGLSWHLLYETCMVELAKGLIELGVLTDSLDKVMSEHLYKPFSVHKTGHWLGMDVHDVGSYHDENGDWVKLVAGNVFTIEPGLYFPEDCEMVDEKWRGIGIRIEDDILVTEQGYENLSAQVPRTIKEIESFMSNAD